MSETLLCGIDEAGRGPLAGPVCAASVILPEHFPKHLLADSKKLKAATREELKTVIFGTATAWGLGWVSASEIDQMNIHNASLLAMERAFTAMMDRIGQMGQIGQVGEMDQMNEMNQGSNRANIHVIVDGKFSPRLPVPCQPLVKADTQIPEVMAASILAKTSRDRLMEYYSVFYPRYGYERHKGYPTKAHRQAIALYGTSPIQRLTYSWR